MLVYNESTGQWEEDGAQETIIPPAPPDFQATFDRGGFQPGEKEALATKYAGNSPGQQIPMRERVTDVTPSAPAGIPYVQRPPLSAEEEANMPKIIGYGKRVALIRPGQETINASGESVSPEYIKDIEDTLAAVHGGDMSETALKGKIARQEGIPSKPTDQQLSATEQILQHRQIAFDIMKERDIPLPNPQKAKDDAESEIQRSYNEGLSVADMVLRKPKEVAQINAHARTAGQAAFQHEQTRYDQLVTHIDAEFEKRRTEDQEAKRNTRELGEKQAADKQKREERQEDAWQIVGDQMVNKYTGKTKPIEGLQKKTTSVDLKRLSDMVSIATKGGVEPSASDVAVISDMADKAGYEFKKLTGKTAEYGLPGIDKPLWGGKETSEWRLVPKGGGEQPATTESGLMQDLMSHGHSKASAEAYIKKAKAKGKL